MSSRKTPNAQKRLEQFRSANTTQQPWGPQSADSSRLNASRLVNLDETRAGVRHAAATDAFESTIAYNSYLQALMKQHSAEEENTQDEQRMNDHLQQQNLNLQLAENTLEKSKSELASYRRAVEINEWLQKLKQHTLSFLEQSFVQFSVTDGHQDLTKIISIQLGCISAVNIKPVESQGEFEQLQATIGELKETLKRITNLHGNNIQQVPKLVDLWKNFTVLHQKIVETIRSISQINEKAAAEFLQSASQVYAQAYE